jgi:predicted phosphodiesterase
MPTIGIRSDTHGWLDENILDVFAKHQVSRIIHAGDVGEYDILKACAKNSPVEAVYGNIDSGKVRNKPETWGNSQSKLT